LPGRPFTFARAPPHPWLGVTPHPTTGDPDPPRHPHWVVLTPHERSPDGLERALREVRANHGATESFDRLQEQLAPRLFRYFRAHSFSPEDAEDLVQGVLARVWQGLPGLRQEDRFLAWLFTIARNVRRVARTEQLRERSWRAADTEWPDDLPDPRAEGQARDQLRAERMDVLDAAIDALPAQQRQCLLLRVRHELSYEEIAETLGLSLNTVRNHLSAAKKNLRRRLGVELDTGASRRNLFPAGEATIRAACYRSDAIGRT